MDQFEPMKLNSKYFDSIRISRGRRGRTEAPASASSAPGCQWRNCTKRGLHRAPKGRVSEGEYYYFCREHVTEYNKAYNYFAGMGEEEVIDFQKVRRDWAPAHMVHGRARHRQRRVRRRECR